MLDHVQFVSTLSFDVVAETGNIVAKNGNNVEATFDFVERIVRFVTFDNVASTVLLVWAGPHFILFRYVANHPGRLSLLPSVGR